MVAENVNNFYFNEAFKSNLNFQFRLYHLVPTYDITPLMAFPSFGPNYRTEADGPDFISLDQKEIYEVKEGGRGIRDLRDGAIQLAIWVQDRPQIVTGYLLILLERISEQRIQKEWRLILQVLSPSISSRLNLRAVVNRKVISLPPEPGENAATNKFIEWALSKPSLPKWPYALTRPDRATVASWKQLEIEKVLLSRWLRKEPPINVGTLGELVGCSYPTTKSTLDNLSARGLLDKERVHAVSLSKYSAKDWEDLFRSHRAVYTPLGFTNILIEPHAIEDIQYRLNQIKPNFTAIGGVQAARHWDPSFDLNGVPRIDLVIHQPAMERPIENSFDPRELVRRLDPALQILTKGMDGAKILVIHPIFRNAPLFDSSTDSRLPWADPVDVIIHLYELGLITQVEDLIRRFRKPEVRP